MAQPSVQLARALAAPAGHADVATCVAAISGGAIIAGYTTTADGNEDGLVLRIDRDGDVVWRREIGGKREDNLWAIQPDPAGGFVCSGYTASTGAGALDGWLVHIDADGATQWDKTFGQAGDDRFWSLARDGDHWLAVGETEGREAGGVDALVVRVDAAGKELAAFTNGGPDLDRAFAVVPMPNGGCAIGGMTGKDRHHALPFVARLDANGKQSWRQVLQHPGYGVAHDLHRAANGDLLAFGYATAGDRTDPGGLLMRLSPAGEHLAAQRFGGATSDRILHARVFADDSAMVVGYAQRQGPGDPDARWDLCTWRLNAAGQVDWVGRFGGDKVEFGRGVAGDAADLWIVGHTASSGGTNRVFVVRLDALAGGTAH
jgi:hypothetical protein